MATAHDEKTPGTPETLCDPGLLEATAIGPGALDEKESRYIPQVGSTHQEDADAHSFNHSTIATDEDIEQNRSTLERIATPVRPTVKVPRSKRRGLFARFALVAEVTHPQDYDRTLKWFITFIVAFSAIAAPAGSSIFFPALDQVTADLHTTATITNLSVSLYMLSMAIFPLWWSAFSEASGRRTVYLTSFAVFIVFACLGAVSNSIAMLIVMRMLSGGAAASVQAVGAGTIADLWEVKERGKAMSTFYLGPLCGPLLSPIIGGLIAQRWNWRATLWALAIYGLITWVFIFFALPETLMSTKNLAEEAVAEEIQADTASFGPTLSRISTREQVQKRGRKYLKMARIMFIDPLKVLAYLRFPAVFLTVYYASVTFGSLYVLNVSVQYSFANAPYEFSTIIVGLLYIPNSIGYISASLVGGRWMDYIMKREAKKAQRFDEHGRPKYIPEDRMRENAWLGALIYPAALIWYGWTIDNGVYWLVPAVANFFYGVGSMLIFAMATTMLTEFMPEKSSSGVAVNNFVRNIFSCIGAFIGVPLINAIGNGWLFTILGIWAISSSAVIWAMRKFGPQWRKTMDRKLNDTIVQS
jgi:multidrug resistance protein